MNKPFPLLVTAVAILCLGTLLGLAGCSQQSNTSSGAVSSSDSAATATKYTCSMHPDVITDKPGKCPKCGMDLVLKK